MIREYIDKIADNKKTEDMEVLGDMLADIIYEMKDSHPDMYDEYKMELYEMAYGKVLTEEMAEKIVEKMKPFGKKWTLEETKNVQNQFGLSDIRDVDFFVVMNMAYNDYKDLFEEDAEKYAKFSKDFIVDDDAKEGKVYTYFMTIPE